MRMERLLLADEILLRLLQEFVLLRVLYLGVRSRDEGDNHAIMKQLLPVKWKPLLQLPRVGRAETVGDRLFQVHVPLVH